MFAQLTTHSRIETLRTQPVPITTEQQLIGIAGVLCYSMFYNSSHDNLGKQATAPNSARAGIKHNTAMLVQ